MSTQKILWALQPNSLLIGELSKQFALLSQIAPECLIEPVALIPFNSSSLHSEELLELGERRKAAQLELMQLTKDVTFRGSQAQQSGLGLGTVLLVDEAKGQDAVEVLCDYAKRMEVRFIAVSNKGKEGFDRLIYGSFSKSLMEFSPVPVLLSNPQLEEKRGETGDKISRILFATDFTAESLSHFVDVTRLARKLHGRVTVYHHSLKLKKKLSELGLISKECRYWKTEETGERDPDEKTLELWREAAGKGVPLDFIPQDQTSTNEVGIGIVAAARRIKADLIAMSHHTSPFASSTEGSIAEYVSTHAGCWVWVKRGDLVYQEGSIKRA